MATFKTRARALDMLGRQQIAGIPTAISELFKNAHDAYADRVEVDYYRSDRLFVLRDDGVGMTEEEFLTRWLTLGTESKVVRKGMKPPPKAPDKLERVLLGEKGVGRLAIAIIGPQVLVLSRAERDGKLCDLVAAFINWGFFELPGVDLDQIEIPVRTFPEGKVPTADDLQLMVIQARGSLDALRKIIDDKDYFKIRSELDAFALNPAEVDGYVEGMSLAHGHGTHFIILPASEILNSDIDEGWERDGAPNIFKMLRGFCNTMTPGHPNPLIRTAFRDHKTNDAYEDLLDDYEFFTPDEFRNADHTICGEFDEYGQFNGVVTVYGKEYRNHIISWSGGHGTPSRCGKFTINVAVVQGALRESTLPLEDWGQLISKMNRFGGLYIYRDGVRMLPYGNTNFDWLGIERNRTKSASYYYFSFRRMFGLVDISTVKNKDLIEKAGREGLRENGAYKDFKAILENFFFQLAADFFRKDAVDDHFRNRLDALNEQARAREKREQQKTVKQGKLQEDLEVFFRRYDAGEPQEKVAELIRIIRSEIAIALAKSDSGDAAEALMQAEENARSGLVALESRYTIAKPRIGLTKKLTKDWDDYCAAFAKLKDNVFAEARQLVEGEVQERAAEARVALSRRLRIERSLNAISTEAKKVARAEKKATDERAALVNVQVLDAAKQSVAKVNRTMAEVFADFARLDVTEMDDASVVEARNRFESKLMEVRDKERAFLQSLQSQLEAIDTSGAPSYIEQMEAVEQRAIALEEQAGLDLQLTQLGMAIEVINHEFDSSIRSIRSYIRRLKGWADINEGLEGVYQGIRNSFEHLDGYLSLFTPLHRRLYRKEIVIEGVDIFKFLNDLFSERFRRHEVCLEATPAFKKAEIVGYPSSFYPVFVNLVDNAVFWLKDQSERVVSLDERDGTLIVKDTGPGIPERDRESVFELGFSRKPGGRGMGLHISREVLSRVEYNLTLTPTNRGAEFHIEPRKSAE